MNGESVVYEQAPLAKWERRLRQVMLVVARLGLAYLFFSQLFWKMPPDFGCPSDFAFTTGGPDDSGRVQLQRTSGLCDWIGIEVVWSDQPRPFFVANLDNQGPAELKLDLGWAARLNGFFLENVVQPNIRWFGWLIWGAETFIFVSLFLGLFSRLGGLVAIGISGQLALGLAGISNPYEWEWSYNLMVLLSLVMFAFAPGRVFGIDAWLRPRLLQAAEGGRRLAQALTWLT
ncbi:MAG: TQO small subunit DoxD [Anaerolineae bacterium]|jgi:hypothetical protein